MTRFFASGHALIIGVGGDLPVTVRDAEAIAELLADPVRCAYPPPQVRLLTGRNARRDDVLGALDELIETTRHADDATVIVYFSGHGIASPGFHLLPYGYDTARLADTAIAEGELSARLGALAARKLVVVLDSCHAGGQANVKTPAPGASSLPDAVLRELGQSAGRVVLASSRRDEVSSYLNGAHHSEFTGALLEALAGYGAAERDGYARVLDVAMYVGIKVAIRSSFDSPQHPVIKVARLEDNFALAYYAGGEKSPKALEHSRLPNASRDPLWHAEERREWLEIARRMSEFAEYRSIPGELAGEGRRFERRIAARQASPAARAWVVLGRLHRDEPLARALGQAGELVWGPPLLFMIGLASQTLAWAYPLSLLQLLINARVEAVSLAMVLSFFALLVVHFAVASHASLRRRAPAAAWAAALIAAPVGLFASLLFWL